MNQTIFLIQIILGISLMVVILLQQKGSGLGSTFGGGDASVYRSKRGAEKMLFYATILLAVLLIAVSLLGLAF